MATRRNTNPFRRQESAEQSGQSSNSNGLLVDLSDDKRDPFDNTQNVIGSNNPFYDRIPAAQSARNPFEGNDVATAYPHDDQASEVDIYGGEDTDEATFGEGEKEFFQNYGVQSSKLWRADVIETNGVIQTTGQLAIVKMVRKKDPVQIIDLKREIAVLQVLKDVDEPSFPRLVQWLDFKSSICMALEQRSSHSLSEYVESSGILPEESIKPVFIQFFSAVTNLFLQEFAHLRICEETVHLDDQFNLILTDFKYVHNYGTGKDGDIYAPIKEKYGSDIYVAPEVFANITYNARKAVLWSCGVVLYYMVTGQTEKLSSLDHPSFDTHATSRRKSVATKVQASSHVQIIHYPNRMGVPGFARDIISKLLIMDPLRRAELIEVAAKVPKEFIMHGTRPLMEMAWLDYKSHVGPLAGTLRRNTITDTSSSIFSFSSRFSDPLTNFMGRRKSSIAKNLRA